MTRIDLSVLELLCSRICHDLAGTASAINAGAELLAEGDDAQTLELLARSGRAMAARLRMFRLAFGRGGKTSPFDDHRRALEAVLTRGGKVALSWHISGAVPDPGLSRLMAILLILIGDALPLGGDITVEVDTQRRYCAIAASGSRIALDAASEAVLSGRDGETLDSRSVLAAVARAMSERLGVCLELTRSGEKILRIAAIGGRCGLDLRTDAAY